MEKDAIHWDDSKYTRGLASMFERSFEQTLDLPSTLNSLSLDEQINLLFLALKKVGQVFGKTELKRIWRVYKANMQAMAQYVPQKVYPNQITLLRAIEVSIHEHHTSLLSLSESSRNLRHYSQRKINVSTRFDRREV